MLQLCYLFKKILSWFSLYYFGEDKDIEISSKIQRQYLYLFGCACQHTQIIYAVVDESMTV